MGLKKYRVYCITEGTWVETKASSEPTQCPNDAGHSISSGSTAEIENILIPESEFEAVTSEGISSTTSTSYQNKIDYTTAVKPEGTYRIGFSCEVTTAANDKAMPIAFLVDNIIVSEVVLFEKTVSSAENFVGYSSFYYKTISVEAAFNLKIQYKTVDNTTYIRRARIDIWKVS